MRLDPWLPCGVLNVTKHICSSLEGHPSVPMRYGLLEPIQRLYALARQTSQFYHNQPVTTQRLRQVMQTMGLS